MAMGRQKDGQGDLMVSWSEMPRSPGHVFYDRLQSVLIEGGFDAFAEASCRPYYAARMGAPSVPPGRYFRMHLVGYFEGIDSERGLEWRCSDSLSLRAFLRLGSRDRVPDHSWLSRSRTRLPHEVHAAVFDWVLVLIAEAGLIKGERIGVDASTMEANAALRNIVRRANGEGYREMLERLARESGVETPTAEDLERLERKRKGKKLSNTDWVSKSDPEAKIAKMKDGTTHLAYKPEHAVDLDTGAVVAAELHPADEGDTTTLSKTLAKAEANLGAVDAAPTAEDPAECVADKGYHSRAVLRALDDSPWKTRIAAPKQTGFSYWHGDEAARRAVTNNRARLKSGVAREAFKLRAEIVERCFAHNLDRGGMRRTWLRGRENVHKRYLLHVAGHNLSLLMRQLIGAGTPREAVAGGYGGIFVLLTPTGAMLVARGGLAKRPDGFRRRIPHLGVRAGKSHLINGLIGQKNPITRSWARKGTRPRQPADQRYQNAYLFGAICPKMGKGAALMLPFSNTAAMQIHLNEISRHVAPKAHGVVLMDRAGWHTTGKLNTPKNITIILLPSRAPELNPVENIWQYIRSNWLSNRVFDDYEAILDAGCEAWNKLLAQPETIKSIGMRDWAHVSQS